MSTKSIFYSLVADFHKAFNIRQYEVISFVPREVFELRVSLILEEEKELAAAQNDIDLLDAICDLIYVLAGASHVTNVGLAPIETWNAKAAQKITITNAIDVVIDELQSAIPCQQRLFPAISAAAQVLVDIGKTKGFNLLDAFREVHKTNMAKLWSSEEMDKQLKDRSNSLIFAESNANKLFSSKLYIAKNAKGKVIKPPNWIGPNLKPYIKPITL